MQETIKKSALLEAQIQAFLEKDGCTQGWGDSFLVAPHAEGLFGITEEEIEENITGNAGYVQGHMYENDDILDEESSGIGEHYSPSTAYTFWQN